MMDAVISAAPVGSRVWFDGERQGYTVRARSRRYLVCTKPFNLQKTVLYTVVDLDAGVRGTENLVFGLGAETDEQCEEMVARLEGATDYCDSDSNGPPPRTEVSRRNRVRLRVTKIVVTP